jgi:hypothetical protein
MRTAKIVETRHAEERNALNQFKHIFLKMNSSYQRTKNYFDQKFHFTDKLFYYAFLANKAKPTRKTRVRSVP